MDRSGVSSTFWRRSLLGLGVLGLMLLAVPRPFLVLSTVPDGNAVAVYAVSPQDRFTVEWVHSVELTPWRETYEVSCCGGMTLAETSFRSFGAGVPSTLGGEVRIRDGWVVADGLNERRDEVVYVISRPDYTLTVNGRTVSLASLVSEDAPLSFAVRWRPWWHGWFYAQKE